MPTPNIYIYIYIYIRDVHIIRMLSESADNGLNVNICIG